MAVAGQQSAASIDECAVGTAQILYQILSALMNNPGMTAGDLGFRIVLIEIDVGENTAIGIPAADIGFRIRENKLFADSAAALNNQFGSSSRFAAA